MFSSFAKRLFGSANDRSLKQVEKKVPAIEALETEMKALSDEALRARTAWLKERLQKGESLNDLIVDAFATVREAARRVLGQRPYNVQLVGGMILNQGMICEMRTGEGKTLVATLPAYLNALTGKGVHVVTVNDYLAKRDSSWMGEVHRFLGLTVGCIYHDLTDEERRAAYAADITYGTNHEIGFDYLRDNMKFRLEERVQRPFNYAIVDEVDSILIDEARTPLIISGPSQESADVYGSIDKLIYALDTGDYEKDEKQRSVNLTEQGAEKIEDLLEKSGLLKGGSLYDSQNISLMHHVLQALKAHKIFQKDVDYIVKNDKVIIIDEFTGRMMEGRRYSDGLHQALEAKEHVTIEEETQTLASITYQNLFRLYPKLSGMTGTALTEAGEFGEIYGLEVVEVPTNRPMVRKDLDDEVYRTAREKYDAIIKLIEECRVRNQPVLVGTVSIEKSELLGELLKKKGIPHQVLNARYHEQEAKIVAEAGRPGAVTIATNMAGRGTDIQLGGSFEVRLEQAMKKLGITEPTEELKEKIRQELAHDAQVVREAGGLYVIGTERHESRRIDNQLRGRSGRQGDPGASKFFLSLEDDLMRIFGSQKLDTMLQRLGLQEGEAIIHPWINKALEKAQQKVEARNFDIRKHLLKYDDVMNDQRKVIYEQRLDIMQAQDLNEILTEMRHDIIEEIVRRSIPEHAYSEQWDIPTLKQECKTILNLDLPVEEWAKEEGIADAEIKARLLQASDALMVDIEKQQSVPLMRLIEKNMLLRFLDQGWKEHLLVLDHLRDGINLRAYAQRDPLNEYKQEAFSLFQGLLTSVRQSVTAGISNLNNQLEQRMSHDALELPHGIDPKAHESSPEEMIQMMAALGISVGDSSMPEIAHEEENAAILNTLKKEGTPIKKLAFNPSDITTWEGNVRRNDVCPCGSGKKYKQCHGKV